jgi:hypothetical protein
MNKVQQHSNVTENQKEKQKLNAKLTSNKKQKVQEFC